jgi:hypothetical protein
LGWTKHETANVAPERCHLEKLIASIFDCRNSAKILLARLQQCAEGALLLRPTAPSYVARAQTHQPMTTNFAPQAQRWPTSNDWPGFVRLRRKGAAPGTTLPGMPAKRCLTSTATTTVIHHAIVSINEQQAKVMTSNFIVFLVAHEAEGQYSLSWQKQMIVQEAEQLHGRPARV